MRPTITSSALAAILLGVLAGCTTTPAPPSAREPTARPTSSGTPPPVGSFDPTAALAVTFESKIFDPPFRISKPANWVAAERDAAAFQLYYGDEDFEITIDHTYQHAETAEAAMARLLGAPSLTARSDREAITVGGHVGQTVVIDASAPVLWSDSGYHINSPNLSVRLVTVPVDGGETVSIFIVANAEPAAFAALDEIARRILDTLVWVPAT
jgi:hypothetical protein